MKVILSLLSIWLLSFSALAEDLCDVGPVENITVSSTALSWSEPLGIENCSISYYVVEIENEEHHFIYTVYGSTTQSLYNLPICQTFNFTIMPVSNNVEGEKNMLIAKIPSPDDATYEIAIGDLTQNGHKISVEWSVVTGTPSCLSEYRISYWNESSLYPIDVQVNGTAYTIQNAVYCTEYKVEVRALLDNLQEGPFDTLNFTTKGTVPTAPILIAVNPFPTSISMSWDLTSAQGSKCPLGTLILDAEPEFSQNFTITSNQEIFNATVEDLEPSTAYVTQAYVVNNIGSSPVVNVVLQTSSNATDDSWMSWE